MALFSKKKAAPAATDEIPERIYKRLHLAYFIFVCILYAFVFIMLINFVFVKLMGVDEASAEDLPFLRHEYCGTFFVEINSQNSFTSPEAYDEYLEKQKTSAEQTTLSTAAAVTTDTLGVLMLLSLLIMQKARKLPKPLDNRCAKTVWIYAALILMFKDVVMATSITMMPLVFLALRSGEKKTIFQNRSADYFLMGGALWLVGNIAVQIKDLSQLTAMSEGMIGVFSQPVYYLQLYRVAAVPIVMMCGGLMLRQHELALSSGSTARNSKLLRGMGIAILAGSGAYILCRLGVRIYELVRVMSGGSYSVKLPFTVMDLTISKLIELPFDMANTPQDYKNVILYRFVKDFPVFVLSAAAVMFFVKALFRFAKGELNTRTNRRYLNIAMLLLIAASLWFNLMGIKELDLFNNGFGDIYGEVVYTIALRSMTEPAMYALVLWFFKTYLQAIPEK